MMLFSRVTSGIYHGNISCCRCGRNGMNTRTVSLSGFNDTSQCNGYLRSNCTNKFIVHDTINCNSNFMVPDGAQYIIYFTNEEEDES